MTDNNSQEAASLDYRNWEQQYAVLDLEQRKDPIRFLMDLCTDQSLSKTHVDA